MIQKTPWFPSNIKPVRVGVYETKWYCVDSWERGFSYWNGDQWTNGVDSPDRADFYKNWVRGAYQEKKWRGFTKELK